MVFEYARDGRAPERGTSVSVARLEGRTVRFVADPSTGEVQVWVGPDRELAVLLADAGGPVTVDSHWTVAPDQRAATPLCDRLAARFDQAASSS